MLIREITLRNLLSFGPDTPPLELRPLNVLIGPNGSGKSNFIEAIGLLQAAPTDVSMPILEGGGIEEWIWKGSSTPETPSINVEVHEPGSLKEYSIWHGFGIQDVGRLIPHLRGQKEAIEISDEWVEVPKSVGGQRERIYDGEGRKSPVESADHERFSIRFDPGQSILAQIPAFSQFVADASPYLPSRATNQLLSLAEFYKRVRIYRDWSFGRQSHVRQPRRSDLRGDSLSENLGNLGLVLGQFKRDLPLKKRILELLKELYPNITGFDFGVHGGMGQLYIEEERFEIPATRLSDGTLRYLCLLAILCHPEPPPLICIEEPELGLHPDVLVNLAKLIKEASERTQLIITTHSEILVDALTYSPDDVVVFEKGDRGTVMRRLDGDDLKEWLEHYTLGQLWSRGEIGGNRW